MQEISGRLGSETRQLQRRPVQEHQDVMTLEETSSENLTAAGKECQQLASRRPLEEDTIHRSVKLHRHGRLRHVEA